MWIKNLSVKIAAFFLGAILILFGLFLGNGFHCLYFDLSAQNIGSRMGSLFLGIVFVGYILGIEFLATKNKRSSSEPAPMSPGAKGDLPAKTNSKDTQKKKLQGGSWEDFLETGQTYLNHFDGRICRGYSADIELSPIAERVDLLLVKIRYKYEKRITNSKLCFKFRTIRNQMDVDKGKASDDGRYEWNCNLDERDIKSPPPAELYDVTLLSVKDKDLRLNLKRLKNDGESAVEFEAPLPPDISPTEPVHLDFEVTFPMESESFWVIDFEEPTNRFAISFNFTAMGDNFAVISREFISSKSGPNQISRASNKRILHLEKDGWIFPKNGVVFYWYNTKK